MKLIYVVSSLAVVGASASELILARRAPQLLDTRGAFYGGWPIAATTCPSNTTSCGDGSCCPSSSDCYTAGLAGVAVCCPDSSDCSNTANTLPVCADSSWTLYIGNYYYFCCASGQVGILPDKGSSVAAGLCVDSSVSPPASVLATLYQAAATTAPPSTSTTPSATTSPTSTSPTSTTPSSTSSTAKPSTTSNSSSATVPSTLSGAPSSASSTTQPSSSTHRSNSHTGAIAGGVVGGVVVLILIAVAIWFFGFRRRNNRAMTTTETSYPAGPAEKYGNPRNPELNEIPGQMSGNYGLSEMAASGVSPANESHFKSATVPPAELA